MKARTRTKAAAGKPKRKTKHPTWEHPAGSGIKISEVPNKHGGRVYGVSYRIRTPGNLLGKPGEREFLQRSTREEAERLAEDRFLGFRLHGTNFAGLPAAAQQQAVIAWDILKEHGLGFVEAAEAAVKVLRPAGGSRTVAQVFAELRQSKEARLNQGDMRARSWDDYKTRSVKIELELGAREIGGVTQAELAAWLRKIGNVGLGHGPLGARSVKNYRSCVSELFRYATQKRYCHENPMAQFTREEIAELGGRKNKRAKINILTVEEAHKLLVGARDCLGGTFLPSIVLRLFCGMRTAEIVRCAWHDVRWQEAKPFVHIGEDQAKGRQARNVSIPPNALEWLALCAKKVGPLVPHKNSVGYCKAFRRLRQLAGMDRQDPKTGKWESMWETNDTRHSFGSYHYAAYGDALRTSKEMGHKQGDTMLFSHYRQLTTEAEGLRYFALGPQHALAEPVPFEPIAKQA